MFIKYSKVGTHWSRSEIKTSCQTANFNFFFYLLHIVAGFNWATRISPLMSSSFSPSSFFISPTPLFSIEQDACELFHYVLTYISPLSFWLNTDFSFYCSNTCSSQLIGRGSLSILSTAFDPCVWNAIFLSHLCIQIRRNKGRRRRWEKTMAPSPLDWWGK